MGMHLNLGIFLAAFVAGCSSTETTSSTSSGGTSGTTGSSGSSGSSGTSGGTSGASGTSGATAPAAPKIDAVNKMMGALHVIWTNPLAKCDSVEGERKANMTDGTEMEKYKVVFTVPGDADNKHETSATADMKYTYRLRCKIGTAYSDYSNEVGLNPKQ